MPKKISAASFSADGSYAFFADKFGDVHVAATAAEATAGPKPLLGHFCSIITDLAASPDGKYVISTDRDSKIRVSLLPSHPLQVEPWSRLSGLDDFSCKKLRACMPESAARIYSS